MASPPLPTLTFDFDPLDDLALPDEISSPLFEDLLADLDPSPDTPIPLDLSISPNDSWPESICFHFSRLISIRKPISLLLFHSYLLGKLLHEEELRMLGRLPPTLIRSRKNGRRLHTLFKNTVKHLGASTDNCKTSFHPLLNARSPDISVCQDDLSSLVTEAFQIRVHQALSQGQASWTTLRELPLPPLSVHRDD